MEEEKKKKVSKKWIILAIVVLFLAICVAISNEDDTNSSNNQSNISDNITLGTNIELSNNSYSGARFKITYSDLKKKCNEAGLKEQSYEIESNAPTYNNDVTTDMWCFQAYRKPTLQEKSTGATTIPYDAYYFKITYEKSTQMVVEIQLISLLNLEQSTSNEMFKNYSILLGCIDSKIYDNFAKNLNNSPYTELKDNIFYLIGVTNDLGNETISAITTACSEEEYQYMKNNNGIWKKQVNH